MNPCISPPQGHLRVAFLFLERVNHRLTAGGRVSVPGIRQPLVALVPSGSLAAASLALLGAHQTAPAGLPMAVASRG